MATKVKTAEYELVLMLDAAAPEDARESLAADARSRIEAAGDLRHAETWGVRKLAYEIEQRGEADYRFFRFQTEAPNLDDLRHALRIADGVLRFRIFEVDPKSPLMTPPEITLGPSRDREGRGRGRRRDEEDFGAEPAAEAEAPAEPAPEAEAPAEPASEAEAPAEPAPEAEAPAEPPAEAEAAPEPEPEQEMATPSSEPAAEPAPDAEAQTAPDAEAEAAPDAEPSPEAEPETE